MYFINRDHPPLAFVAQVGRSSDEEQMEHLRELMQLAREDLGRGRRYVLVVDGRYTPPVPAAQRRQLWAALNENHDLVRASTVAHIFIIESALMRGALTALRWIGALPREMQVVANFAAALDTAEAELSTHGCPPIPEQLRGPDGEELAFGAAHRYAKHALGDYTSHTG